MAGWMGLLLLAIATTIATADSRVIPAEPISVMLDAHGAPIMFLRDKRTAARPYPQRAMMFTGYYRPTRRSGNGGQATGVFAQGNAVSGEAFFGGVNTAPRLGNGPEPIDEPEVSSAEAQAAPASGDEQDDAQPPRDHHRGIEVHRQHDDEHHRPYDDGEQHHQHHHHHHTSIPQEHREPEETPSTTGGTAQSAEEPVAGSSTEVPRPKVHHTKKTHKTPVIDDNDDDDDNDDEDDDDDNDEADEADDEPIVPFVPFKGNKGRRQGYPNLNNFFPMVFSFPRVASRAGSSGSPPGTITAIANSYSTGKGGVASSVATAYGGSPTGKKRRPQPYEQ